jgi:DNA repair exonuclease SbcCD ATPase subunit
MALSVHLLTTAAQCDAVTKSLDERLKTIAKRESDLDYQLDLAAEGATSIKDRLKRLASKIAELTSSLAELTPGTDEYNQTDEELADAVHEQKKLNFRQLEKGPVYLVLREAAADEYQARRTTLEADKAAVVARKAEL